MLKKILLRIQDRSVSWPVPLVWNPIMCVTHMIWFHASAIPSNFWAGGQCWYIFSYYCGGRDDTSKSVIVTLSNLWGATAPPAPPPPPTRYGPAYWQKVIALQCKQQQFFIAQKACHIIMVFTCSITFKALHLVFKTAQNVCQENCSKSTCCVLFQNMLK